MELTVLRARAVCASCNSKLPPRSDVWMSIDSDDVWCETCGRFEQMGRAETLADPVGAAVENAAGLVETGRSLAERVSERVAESLLDEVAVEQADEPVGDAEPSALFGLQDDEPTVAEAVDPVAAVDEPRPGPDGHEAGPAAEPEPAEDAGRSAAVTSLVPRMRLTEVRGPTDPRPEGCDAPADRLRIADPISEPAAEPSEEPSATSSTVEMLPRGDVGEGRVGQTLEAARIHGLEVLHGIGLGPDAEPMQHLVVSGNGLWVIRAVPVLSGKLERQDVGDWFTADPRLYIGDSDRTALVTEVRCQVDFLASLLARTPFSDVPVRGVLCFGSVQPGWVSEPFVVDAVSITWRSRLVEPFLDPVRVDRRTRARLVQALVRLSAATAERMNVQPTAHPATG